MYNVCPQKTPLTGCDESPEEQHTLISMTRYHVVHTDSTIKKIWWNSE